MVNETSMPNEPRPWVYWDVEVVGYTPDDRADEVLIERLEYVGVDMNDARKTVSVRNVNEEEVAFFRIVTEDDDPHIALHHQGVEIMNIVTDEDRSVFLKLRPAQVHNPATDRDEPSP